jgi:hypothetical protein
MTQETAPTPLRERIAGDLAPVAPLRKPWLRAAAALPLGVLLLFAASTVFSLRADAGRLGWTLTWGLSTVELALGMLLIGMALRDAVPGRVWSPPVLGASLLTTFAAIVLITLVTWRVSPTRIVGEPVAYVTGVCFGYTLLAAVPVILLAGLLVARAYPLRPWIAGALYGAGAGLLSDAGWRLFCHYSDPWHVFPSHLGAVVAASLLGALTGWFLRPRASSS